jgi:hypothetical protein
MSTDVDALEKALHLVSSWDNATYARVRASAGEEGAGGGAPLHVGAGPSAATIMRLQRNTMFPEMSEEWVWNSSLGRLFAP